MPLDQNPNQTVTRFGCVGFSMYACGFYVPKFDNFACLHTSQDQNELHLKRWFSFAKIDIFCKSIADPVSEAKTHWMANWLQLLKQFNFVWRHTKVFIQNSSQWWSPKCSLVENDGELMLMVLHTHILPHQQYSRVYALFLPFHASVYRWGCQFLSLFSQDNDHKELLVLLFFQNSYAIFAHFLKHYHDFQSNVAIFPNVVLVFRQPYSFGGRIKLIICQVRHEVSVTIREISTGGKKR